MRNYFLSFVLSAVIILLSLASAAQNYKLTIKVTGIEDVKGKIQIGIYNDAKKFPNDGEQYKVVYIPVNSTVVSTTVSLPAGTYAIALMHDEDSDGECDMNFIGMPTEKYGFSNNVKPLLSAPSFNEAKFDLKADKTIQINLID